MSENRPTPRALKQRFKVITFKNRTGSIAWRCYGVRRDGQVIRENFKDPEAARNRQLILETEYHAASTLGASSIQATRLSDDAIAIAERAFARLDRPEDLLAAVDHWLRVGRHQHRPESPRVDDAFKQFEGYLDDPASGLRPLSARNLRTRCRMFVNGSDNLRVCDLTPQHIDSYLSKRSVSSVTKGNDRRAVSSFLSWCRSRIGLPKILANARSARGEQATTAAPLQPYCRSIRCEHFSEPRNDRTTATWCPTWQSRSLLACGRSSCAG